MSETLAALEGARERCRQTAAAMPIRMQRPLVGEFTQVPAGGWFTLLDQMAWHEAAHAVVYAAYGWIVELVTIDPHRSLSEGQGSCTALPRRLQEERVALEVHAIAGCAGAIGAAMIFIGLGLERMKSDVTIMSPSDRAQLSRFCEVVLGEPLSPPIEDDCKRIASDLLYQHRTAYGALVAALVQRQTLDQHEISDLLSRDDPAHTEPPGCQ